MLSSTGNDVESGANGFRVSRGDIAVAENDGANPHAREESVNHDQLSSVRPSSAVQRSGKSTSQDHDDPLSPSTVHGSTPLSQIGAHPCAPVNDMYLGQGKSERCCDVAGQVDSSQSSAFENRVADSGLMIS